MAIFNVYCNSGGLLAIATDGAGNVAGGGSGNNANIMGGALSATGTHTNNGDLSFIMTGDTNTINSFVSVNSCYNSIFNGSGNQTCGCNASVYNGVGNCSFGYNVDVYNGCGNIIIPLTGGDSSFSSISNGQINQITGIYSFIGNGQNNCIFNGENATIVNAGYSCVSGIASFIGSGEGNVIYNPSVTSDNLNNFSFIGTGNQNSILVGYDFPTKGTWSSIINGNSNTICACNVLIGTGCCNIVNKNSHCSFIGVGMCQNIGNSSGTGYGAPWSSIVGGCNNLIDDAASATCYAQIGGGQGNIICNGACYGAIYSGCGHSVNACNSYIGSGCNNKISSGAYSSFIGSGVLNTVCTNAYHGTVGGGYGNTICSGAYDSTISGGCNNIILANNDQSAISGGYNNKICAVQSWIGGGSGNVAGGAQSTLAGGQSNTNCGSGSAIAGGLGNTIYTSYSFIGGGAHNAVTYVSGSTVQTGNTIAGGDYICICSAYGTVAGGCNNFICGCKHIFGTNCYTSSFYSTLGGGCGNRIFDAYGVISGGCGNVICDSSFYVAGTGSWGGGGGSFIGGGYGNTICANHCFGVITGGQSNILCQNACFGIVSGGYQNCVSGCFSAILGGSGNYDNGCCYVGIFGQNINSAGAMANCTFHVNCLNACSTPTSTHVAGLASIPHGTIFYADGVTPPPAGSFALYFYA